MKTFEDIAYFRQAAAQMEVVKEKAQAVVEVIEIAAPDQEDHSDILARVGAVNTKAHRSDQHHHIVASPYYDSEHQLDLTTIDSRLGHLAQALTGMKAIRADFATAAYREAFDWNAIVNDFVDIEIQAGKQTSEPLEVFVIVFRSQISPSADRELLGELDRVAHLEAVQSGGLLKYWFGVPDHNGRNLATCLWRDREDAKAGGAGPGHAQSMQAARKMYREWYVERHRLSIDAGSRSWSFSPWSDELASS